MFIGKIQKLLLTGAAFFLSVSLHADQYPNKAKSTKTTVTVNVVWLKSFREVNATCLFLMEREQTSDKSIVGCYDPTTQTIYSVEPSNFNEHFLLEILGHEFWHALGAEHPAI